MSDADKPAEPMLPSEIIKARASKIEIVEDALGRKIGVRRVGPMQRVNLSRILSVEDANKPGISGHYALAYACVSIDGADYPLPSTMGELDMMLQRLDDEGVNAIAKHVAKTMGMDDKEVAQAAKN